MGLAHPLHLPHHLHLATDSDLGLDLVDLLHLAADSDSAAPNESGDDFGSESFQETDLHGSLPDQSHHPEEGEPEGGGVAIWWQIIHVCMLFVKVLPV
jgi:hypothetical protein